MELEQALEELLGKAGVKPTEPGLKGMVLALEEAVEETTNPVRAAVLDTVASELRMAINRCTEVVETALFLPSEPPRLRWKKKD